MAQGWDLQQGAQGSVSWAQQVHTYMRDTGEHGCAAAIASVQH